MKPNAQRDLRASAFHEAGHVLAARLFGLNSSCILKRVRKPTVYLNAWTGRTYMSSANEHQTSVIGWAGPCAEELHDNPNPSERKCTLSCDDVNQMSHTDRAFIIAEADDWDTVLRNLDEAESLIREHREVLMKIVAALLSPSAILPGSKGSVRCSPPPPMSRSVLLSLRRQAKAIRRRG